MFLFVKKKKKKKKANVKKVFINNFKAKDLRKK
jgi:hypothetical protein